MQTFKFVIGIAVLLAIWYLATPSPSVAKTSSQPAAKTASKPVAKTNPGGIEVCNCHVGTDYGMKTRYNDCDIMQTCKLPDPQ